MKMRLKIENSKATGVFVNSERLAETLNEGAASVWMNARDTLESMEAKAKHLKQATSEIKALDDYVNRLMVFAITAANALEAVAKANDDNSVFAERLLGDGNEYSELFAHQYLGEIKLEDEAA